MYKISELAHMGSVSVRTLHHYDAIGLLKPSGHSEGGYRLYSDEDAQTLQQILFFKEIGFPLKEIKQIIEDPAFNRDEALLKHRLLLQKKAERLQQMLQTIDYTLAINKGNRQVDGHKLFGGFSMDEIKEYQKKYRDEAIEKYGKHVIGQVEERTGRFTDEDWQKNQEGMNVIFRKIAAGMAYGPGSEDVQKAVSEWRQFITDHYYECTPPIFRGLADVYTGDERFRKNIDRIKPGLTDFLSEAIITYCNRLK